LDFITFHTVDFKPDFRFLSSTQPKRVIKIKGDGNCLFRCFSKWLTGDEQQHYALRSFITQDHNERHEMRSRLGVWGTSDEFFQFAKLFKVHVMVWSKFGQTMAWSKFPSPENNSKSVYLDHRFGDHFDLAAF
jgi:hypothetical protein